MRFKEHTLEHLLYGVLHYADAMEGENVIEFGDEHADKFYQVLEGEVAVWVPQPKAFNGSPAQLVIFLIKNYDSVCWKKMKYGELVQDFLLKSLSRLKVSIFAYTSFN